MFMRVSCQAVMTTIKCSFWLLIADSRWTVPDGRLLFGAD
jgi:hypothetical protein